MRQLSVNLLQRHIRFTPWFMKLQKLFVYTPHEEFIKSAMEYISVTGLEGDYLEFGLSRGARFVPAYHFAQRNKLKNMQFYGFDSFEGLPAINGPDVGGEFAQGQFRLSLDKFTRLISRNGVRLDKVNLVEGWYDSVLNRDAKQRLPLKSAAFVFVDCDLYESTIPVLNFISDYLQTGTVIAFDDWYCFKGDPEKGEQRAFREWLESNSAFDAIEFHKFGWSGNSFIIRANNRGRDQNNLVSNQFRESR
jgi:O-methyltransferase